MRSRDILWHRHTGLSSGDQFVKWKCKSGENGIADAKITFKKGSSEKKVATDSAGNFSIELADGMYTVTIKKTGYLTWTDSVTISDVDSRA